MYVWLGTQMYWHRKIKEFVFYSNCPTELKFNSPHS